MRVRKFRIKKRARRGADLLRARAQSIDIEKLLSALLRPIHLANL